MSKPNKNNAGPIKTEDSAIEECGQKVSEEVTDGKEKFMENHERETCKTTEDCEPKVSEVDLDGEGNHVKNTEKENCEKVEKNSAKESKEKDLKNSLSEIGKESPAIVTQKSSESRKTAANKEKVVLLQDLKDVFQRFGTVKV